MAAAELRGGGKPKLNEALGWIGSRVDDIYGTGVGRLEDVWIDPGTGAPRWLLVKEGRFGGRSTLIPFEDATAGAGHVWVPYERDVVGAAPEIEPGAPLTQQVEAALRSHYAANVPSSISYGSGGRSEQAPSERRRGSSIGTATIRFDPPPEPGSAEPFSSGRADRERQPPPQPPMIRGPRADRRVGEADEDEEAFTPRLPQRPAPPIAAPDPRSAWAEPGPVDAGRQGEPPQPSWAGAYAPPQAERGRAPQPGDHGVTQPRRDYGQQPPRAYAPPQRDYGPPEQAPPPRGYAAPAGPRQPVGGWQRPAPDPAQGPVDQLRALAAAGRSHYVEIELSGELTIRGELRAIRVTPRGVEHDDRR